MTIENISRSISTKECCGPQQGLNPRPPGLHSDGTSNSATEAGFSYLNFSTKMYAKGTHKKHLNVALQMIAHNKHSLSRNKKIFTYHTSMLIYFFTYLFVEK